MCKRKIQSYISFLPIGKKDNSKLGIHMLRNSKFFENTKILLSPEVVVIYTTVVYA